MNISAFGSAAANLDRLRIAAYTGDALSDLSEVGSRNGYEGEAGFDVAVIAGTTYQLAIDTGVYSPSDAVALRINGVPTITSGAAASASVGNGFSYTITASDRPSRFQAIGLPAGLSLNESTGVIEGSPTQTGIFAVALSAKNAGGTGTAVLTLTVDPGAEPLISSRASRRVFVGEYTILRLSGFTPPVAVSATGLPAGLSVNDFEDIIGAVTTAGTYPVTVTASDLRNSTTSVITIVAEEKPHVPAITSSSVARGTVGTPFDYKIQTDGTGLAAPTKYDAEHLPAGLAITTSDGRIQGIPLEAGKFEVPISVTNPGGLAKAVLTIMIEPASVGDPEADLRITSSVKSSGSVGSQFYYQLTAEGSPASFNAVGLPPGLSINPQTGYITGVPLAPGEYNVRLRASNARTTVEATWDLVITATASPTGLDAPLFIQSPASASAAVGQSFSFAIYINEPRGYPLKTIRFGATALPPGLTINPKTGVISGTPTQVGDYSADLWVEGEGFLGYRPFATALVTFSVHAPAVPPPDSAPVITNAAGVKATAGVQFSYQVYSTPAATAFAASGLPPGLSINLQSGSITGMPTTPGDYPVLLSASNSLGSGTGTVVMRIAGTAVPLIGGFAYVEGRVGESIRQSLSMPGATSVTVQNLPPGVSFNQTTREISGIPTATGTFRATISAANSAGTTEAVVTIVIKPGASPLIISRVATGGTVGETFNYRIEATGAAATYAATNLPPGLVVGTSSGQINGTPTVAGNFTSTISATNSTGTGTATLRITIQGGVPQISSSATAAGTVGQSFSYKIATQSAVSGYSALDLPAGLTLNASTGFITGTPSLAGIYKSTIGATGVGGLGSALLTITIAHAAAVQPKPAIQSGAAARGLVGDSFSYKITATGSPSAYGASGLPAGMAVNQSSGLISGVPSLPGLFTPTVTATNSWGTTSAKVTILILESALEPPVITSPAGMYVPAGAAVSFRITASNRPTSFAATDLPPGLTLNSTTGVISGTRTTSGPAIAHVSATNTFGTGTAAIRLGASNGEVNFSSSAGVAGTVGVPLSYTCVSNPSGYAFAINNSSLPLGLSLNSSTGEISGVPLRSGVTEVTVVALSNSYPVGTATLTFAISDIPTTPPVVTSKAYDIGHLGAAFRHTLKATGLPTKFTAGVLPAGLEFDAPSGVIFGRPSVAGKFEVPITAENALGIGTATLTIDTETLPPPPVINVNATLKPALGRKYITYQIDADNAPTSYSVTGLPPGLSLDSASGVISGIQPAPGVYPLEIQVANAAGTATANSALVFEAPDAVLAPAATYRGSIGTPFYQTIIGDSSITSITFSGLPPGLAARTTLGEISGTPTVPGTFPVEVSATTETGTVTAATTFVIDSEPTYSTTHGLQQEGTVGAVFSYDVSTYGTAGPARYGAIGLPPGLSLSADRGTITGVPTVPGTYPVSIALHYSTGSIEETVTIRIANQAIPLVTTGLRTSGAVGVPLKFTVAASDSPQSYAAAGLPPGLAIHPQLGVISGTPTSAGVYNVTISASNAAGTGTATIRFEIAATPPNARPVIVSSAGIRVLATPTQYESVPFSPFGAPVEYVISATNGATTYSASNLPSWLSFDAASGRIHGVPTGVGKYLVPISATNHAGTTNAVLTIDVVGSVAAVTSPGNVLARVGEPLTHTFRASPVFISLFSPYVTTYSARNLPPGLMLNVKTGVLSGTPTRAGTYPVEVLVTNTVGVGKSTVTFVVRPAAATPPVQTLDFVPTAASYKGCVGVPFSMDLVANGVPLDYAGTGLPPGFSLNVVDSVLNGRNTKVGRITGNPTTPGTFMVRASATNNSASAAAVITIAIEARPLVPVFFSSAVVRGVAGRRFTYRIVTQSDPLTALAPRAFTASGLPTGLEIDATTGVIAGIPTGAGEFTVPISATVAGVTGTAVLSISIAATSQAPDFPQISAKAGALGFVGVPFQMPISASNRAQSLTATALPAGLTFSSAADPAWPGDTLRGVIEGVPTAAGVFTVPVSATGPDATASAQLTIRIVAPQFSRPTITQQPIDQVVALGGDATFTAAAIGLPGVTLQWLKNGMPIAGANSATLKVPAVTRSDDAIYRIRASNEAGVVESDNAQLAVMLAYDSWMAQEFTADEIASGRAAATADFNRDGIVNLVEYGLGRNPRTGAGGLFPYASLIPGTNRIRIHFNRDARKPDLDYTVEASNDLATWTPIARSVAGGATVNLGGAGSISETGIAIRAVTVDDGPAGQGVPQRYLRLRLSKPQ